MTLLHSRARAWRPARPDSRLTLGNGGSAGKTNRVSITYALDMNPIHIQVLQARATSPAGTGSPFADVGGAASPTALLSYRGPVSNDPVSITFGQHVGANAALRTGTYAKTLTFTLSTTQP